MQRHYERATLLRDGIAVVEVGATIWVRPPTATRLGDDWGGELSAVTGELLTIDTGNYTLRLENGSEATIIVNNVQVRSRAGIGASSSATFVGNGPSPAF